MKKLIKRIIKFIKKRKYYLLAFFLILFVWWWFCLPKELFDSPTATVLLDKDGELLNAQIAEDGQWRFPYNDSVPNKFKEAIIEFEDHRFYSHIGVSIMGIGRAIKQNISNGEVVSGASTITMQVIRMSRNKPRTMYQKLVEMIWATRLEARHTKDEILALYTSNAPMGGNVVGLDAAAWRYFQRSPFDLSWAESATLAVLPNAPSLIHVGKNRDALKAKRDRLLQRLYEKGKIDKETLEIAKEEELPENPRPLPQLALHLMNKALNEGKRGQRILTTLDVNVQKNVTERLNHHHQRLKTNNIFNGAVIIGEIKTGKIIAYVGNTNVKEREHGGNVDVITARRSSGSILKPFLYGFMIQDGKITPKQVIFDVPTTMAGYSPENYNQKYAGIVPANEALSKSLNVPFVRMLREYGIQAFHSKLKQAGMTTLDKPATHYGLSLILGGCEVTLFDLVSMYAKIGRAVEQFPNYNGLTNSTFSCYSPQESLDTIPFISPSAAWSTISAMEHVVRPNKEKNWEEFSTSERISWKTGTSFGFRDAWAIGLNKEYVVGVWVGNADGEGRPGIIGVEAAAPILFDVFDFLPKSEWYKKPIDEFTTKKLCTKSGMRASKHCLETRYNSIPFECGNNSLCNFHQIIFLDKEGKNRVSSNCYPVSKMLQKKWFTLPPKAAYYYQKRAPDYKEIPAYKEGCDKADNTKQISILYPKNESKIIITRTETGEESSVVMEALHRDAEITLFWHLNEEFIGETNHIHQRDKKLNPGKYVLQVIDELGNSEKITFEVVKD